MKRLSRRMIEETHVVPDHGPSGRLRLPPMNTLRLFESAGRHLSFRRAAQELRITPSAVSHGVQTLEDWLGVPLFARTGRSLALTDAGKSFLPCVSEALTLLSVGTDRVPGRPPRGTLAVSAPPTFAVRWLLPRLARFAARHPDVAVTIDTTHRQVEFPLDGVDLAIRMGRGVWPGIDAVALIQEELVPVCAPSFRAEHGVRADLRTVPLIHVTSVTEDWAAWFEGAGHQPARLDGGLRVDTIQMAFDAAYQGLGVAIGRRPLVDDDLRAGKLVEFCGPLVKCKTGYWLVASPEFLRGYEATMFRAWITEELRAPGA